MVIVDIRTEEVYMRPLDRGIVTKDNKDEVAYLNDLLIEALGSNYSCSGGSVWKNVHILIEADEVKAR